MVSAGLEPALVVGGGGGTTPPGSKEEADGAAVELLEAGATGARGSRAAEDGLDCSTVVAGPGTSSGGGGGDSAGGGGASLGGGTFGACCKCSSG